VKTLIALCGLFLCFAVQAQTTNATPTNSIANTNATASTEAQPTSTIRTGVEARLELAKPNEVVAGNLTLSGILVEAVKTGHPLQLLNPLAPAEYGSSADNVVLNPINGKVVGLKFLAIRF
jgi:hypothetical protein